MLQTVRAQSERVRLVIDRSERTLDADGVSASWQPAVEEIDAALVRYLALVSELRGLPEGIPFEIRSADVDVLGEVFDLAAGEIRSRLIELTLAPSVLTTRRTLRGAILIPVTGLLLAVTAAGAVFLIDESRSAANPVSGSQPAHAITGHYELGEGIAVARPGS